MVSKMISDRATHEGRTRTDDKSGDDCHARIPIQIEFALSSEKERERER